jgi:hypothetical protein
MSKTGHVELSDQHPVLLYLLQQFVGCHKSVKAVTAPLHCTPIIDLMHLTRSERRQLSVI